MKSESDDVFVQLREILAKHAGKLSVKRDTPVYYCLEAGTGPATLRVWKGKMKAQMIPVAWVRIGKAYVSYHLMGLYGNTKLLDGMSKELRARMQGKTCFNFKRANNLLFEELGALTTRSIAALKKTGYISD